MWNYFGLLDYLNFLRSDMLGFVHLILWWYRNWCDIWRVPVFKEIFSYYICFPVEKLNYVSRGCRGTVHLYLPDAPNNCGPCVNLTLSANHPVHPCGPAKSSTHAYTQNLGAHTRTTAQNYSQLFWPMTQTLRDKKYFLSNDSETQRRKIDKITEEICSSH